MALDIGIARVVQVVGVGIVHGGAVIGAQAHTQPLYTVIVHAGGIAQPVGNPVLIRGFGAVVDEVVAVEHETVQAGRHQQFVAPVPGTAPEADARVVPGRRQNGEFPFGPIDREILQRFMGVIETADGDHQMAGADVQGRGEALLNPELLQLHFAAFLDFSLPLAGLRELFFYGAACARVLELDLRLHAPALSEVVS